MISRIIKIVLLLLLPVNVYSEAFFAGGVSSVNADSSFNALRNPALMSGQSADSISFMYQYSYLFSSEAKSDINYLGTAGEGNTSINEDYNGVLYFSGVMHSGRSSFGVGISKNGEDQIVFSSSEGDTQIGPYISRLEEEKKIYGANFLLSYSFRVNSKESVGFQLENSALHESTEKYEINSASETKNFKMEKNRITTGGRFGYNLREENYEFGATVSTGSYGFENQKYELTSSVDGFRENEVSDYYMHDDGFGVIFGFCLKPDFNLKVSLEGGYIIPFSFEEKSWSDETYEESKGEINIMYIAMARGGVNYSFNRFIDFGFGGSFTTYKAKSSGEDSVHVGSSTLYIYQLTSGVDIKPSDGYNILLALGVKRTEIESEFDSGGIRFEPEIFKNSVEALCGVSFKL